MFFFIHGWASTSLVWSNLFNQTDCYFYDSSTYPNYKELSQSFVKVTNSSDTPNVLIGWSLGGMLALQLAYEFPERIKKLILISSTAKFTTNTSYSAGLDQIIVKNLARKVKADEVIAQKNFYKLMFSEQEHQFRTEFLTKSTETIVSKNNSSLQNGLQYLLTTDLRPLLSSINVQTHIIHGSDDGICPLSAGQYLTNNMNHSKLSILQGTGHIPFYTQKDICNQFIFDR
jgi:pimeloyl-[acyl-carrier protein] methyl ester esterase